jgi:hypothetical protein
VDTKRVHAAASSLVATLIVCCSLAGCTTHDRPGAISPGPSEIVAASPPTPTLPCTDPVDARPAPRSNSSPILDAIAFDRAGETIPVDGPDIPMYAKVWLWVHAGKTATLQLPRESGARMMWSNTETKPVGDTFEVPACSSSEGAWLAFPGGFYVTERACLTLSVTANGKTQTIDVPIGKRCPTTR